MGLATSQVRLLALTSRKADVEMQMQLNSKRKTMLTRESTELAKLYYAKLQNAKIQYSTGSGYKDVDYEYLMGYNSQKDFINQVLYPTANSTYDLKRQNSMVLTDAYGRVILDNAMLAAVLDALNDETGGTDDSANKRNMNSVEDYAILATAKFLKNSNANSQISNIISNLLEGKLGELDINAGYDVLKILFEKGVQDGGTLYVKKISEGNYKFFQDAQHVTDCDNFNFQKGYFYKLIECDKPNAPAGVMYTGNSHWLYDMSRLQAQQIVNLFEYYGTIFAAAFNGRTTCDATNGSENTLSYFNVAADIQYNAGTKKYEKANNNDKYDTLIQGDNLQNGLKSGLYQLVNVSSKIYGGYSKAQGVDYFITQNYIAEKADTSDRESITAWYNAAKADLSEKESYWDAEITALSTELNTITAEIESVKTLRKDAIDSTFKWGSA